MQQSTQTATNVHNSCMALMQPCRMPQKLAQLDSQGLLDLLDTTLVWVWLKPKLATLVGDMDKLVTMWNSGCCQLRTCSDTVFSLQQKPVTLDLLWEQARS